MRDPAILILDEATSSLDSHAENIIQEDGPYRALCEEQFGAVQLDS